MKSLRFPVAVLGSLALSVMATAWAPVVIPQPLQAQSTKTKPKTAGKSTKKSTKKPTKKATKKSAPKKPVPCTRPDTLATWVRTQRAWQALDDKRDWTNDSLRNALIAAARSASVATASHGAVEMGASIYTDSPLRLSAADSAAVEPVRALLREMASKRTWPLRSMVGAAGVHAAWVVASGDTALSRMAMHRMMEAGPGEASPADVAVLEDMMRLERGRKQLYGSQMRMKRDSDGVMHVDPAPTEDLAHVDLRRDAAGLPRLADALCAVRAMVPGAK
jgi:hypothetical protein